MKRAALAGAVVALGAAAGGIGREPPMSYLRTFGPAGDPATRLGWGLGIVSIVVMVVIAVLLLAAIYRKRRARRASARELTVARDEGGLSWIYIGVGISTVVLIACAVWTMFTVAAVAMPAARRGADAAGDGAAVVVERALRERRPEPGLRRRQRDPHSGRPAGARRALEQPT